MSTLLLRLAAPLQSWGIDSKFDRRTTERTPSKSGIVGFCAAALGYRRWEDEKIARLAALKFGVRVDKPGVLLKDFHSAHMNEFWHPENRGKVNLALSQNKKNSISYVTTRYYLADAMFLVGLEDNNENYLREIEAAIRAPMFPLFLGRRSCPPEGQVCCGIVPLGLKDALEQHPWLVQQSQNRSGGGALRISIEADTGHFLRDLPRSFNPEHRKFDFRRALDSKMHSLTQNATPHDPIAELERGELP